ncbi:TetR/AcrR family transcriptional regulator [Halopseudomonas maritima]|uniref:TetR/AcrR family transcriptional regulator n=1 Tax=Halopseudomonas maritima TaxID=2918528 RepID=UPI001EE9CE01|nr:TetR/AcrR family transcriptional regulator [Halopseudomonas maritima]UJJ32703.1 TetR/AcrR family transcriptional regulator [Halopseudomonas maritima]
MRSAHETRTRLINEATVLFRERGYSAVGLGELLERSKVSKGSFYFHFESKAELASSCIAHYTGSTRDALRKQLQRSKTCTVHGLQRWIHACCSEMAANGWIRGCLISAFSHEGSALPSGLQQQMVDALDCWHALVAEQIVSSSNTGTSLASTQSTLFWLGWQGAVQQAKLRRSAIPILCFCEAVPALLPTSA